MNEILSKIVWHPVFVHFPIAFYFLELFLLALWVKKNDVEYHRFAYFSFKLGYVFMIAAMIVGYFDAGGWGNLFGMVRNHFFGALSIFTIYTIRFIYWKKGSVESTNYKKLQLTGAILGNFAVIITGYFGGELVFG